MDKSIYYEGQLIEIMPLADHMGITEKKVIKIMDKMVKNGMTPKEAGTKVGETLTALDSGHQAVGIMKALIGIEHKAGPGKLVRTAGGVYGRTFNADDLVGGKVVVYSGTKKMLCTGSKLKMLGFID